ncbi:MAG: hypothetical protein JWN01_455 [Patescibacteria group bacterium]|nr:hypothetical protein [Patescibacteria group bacterium]
MTVGKQSVFSGTDIQFLFTFAAGMGAFWLSGRLPGYLPLTTVFHSYLPALIVTMVLALAVYGLGMAAWVWVTLGKRRARKPILVATGVATTLALISSSVLTFTNLGRTQTTAQLAILAFVLYLIYGIYFVIGWALARKLAK